MDWEELYVKYSDAVYRFIVLMVGNSQTAEDLTQDTFIRIRKSLSTYKGKASYQTWCCAIARNVTIDHLRRKKLVQFLPFRSTNEQPSSDTPEQLFANQQQTIQLYEAIQNLKPAHQEIIILRYIQERSIEETAYILRCTESKVKSTTYQAMQKLKLYYKKLEEEMHDGRKMEPFLSTIEQNTKK